MMFPVEVFVCRMNPAINSSGGGAVFVIDECDWNRVCGEHWCVCVCYYIL